MYAFISCGTAVRGLSAKETSNWLCSYLYYRPKRYRPLPRKLNTLKTLYSHKRPIQETILFLGLYQMVRYIRTRIPQELALVGHRQHVHKFELHNSKPTVTSCNFYNRLPACKRRIKSSCLFKWKVK